MARARLLKPDFFEDEKLAAMPFGARLLFQAYWCLADREGRLEDRPSRIAAFAFPPMGNEKLQAGARRDVIGWRNLLLDAGMVRRYEVEGESFLLLVNWEKHQKIPQHEPRSLLPTPLLNNVYQTEPNQKPETSSVANVAGSRSRSKAEVVSEAEAETRVPSGPQFLTEPPVPDEPGFLGEYTRHENANGRFPSGAAVAAASEIERLYGTEACIEVATDLGWDKHPNYMKPILEDRKNGRLQTAGRHASGNGTRSTSADDLIAGYERYAAGQS